MSLNGINLRNYDLKGNSLVFDPKVMKIWWDTGYSVDVPEYVGDDEPIGLKLMEYRITVNQK